MQSTLILHTNLCVNIKIHGMYVVTVKFRIMCLYTLQMDCYVNICIGIPLNWLLSVP